MQGNKYRLDQIKDGHLLNIIPYIADFRGSVDSSYRNTLIEFHNEALRRGLKPRRSLNEYLTIFDRNAKKMNDHNRLFGFHHF